MNKICIFKFYNKKGEMDGASDIGASDTTKGGLMTETAQRKVSIQMMDPLM